MSKKKDIKMWRELAHILGALTLFIGPLVLYFVKEEKEIKDETREVLNWQLSLLIYLVIASVIQGMLFGLFLAASLTNLLIVVNILLSVIGFVKVHNNEKWQYPLSIEFLKK